MRLSHLMSRVDLTIDPEITSVCEDSRKVTPGALFVAQAGGKTDGARFIEEAVAKGAVAIAVEGRPALPATLDELKTPVLRVANARHFVAEVASKLWARQPETIVAVTGTSGKTSTAFFAQQLFAAAGYKAASMGTLGLRGSITRDGSLTTPVAEVLYPTLQELHDAGVTHLAMEASSQGLHQRRMDFVRVKAAAFTNLSRDHLDYHDTVEAYLAAKLHLFSDVLAEDGVAVLNADAAEYAHLLKAVQARGVRVMSFGKNGADLQLLKQSLAGDGQGIVFAMGGEKYAVHLSVAGAFQAMNVLCALGLCLSVLGDEAAETLIAAMPALQAPPGRLQAVTGHPKGASVYVDYAHKPDALEKVLQALRAHTTGKLVCLFGCGGDRDAGKRPVMGQIAHAFSDRVIVTDDNPRSEDAAKIRGEILKAAPGATEIADRRKAIARAVRDLEQGDVLLIAGKGHETGQIFAGRTDPFNDVDEAQKAIHALPLTPTLSPKGRGSSV